MTLRGLRHGRCCRVLFVEGSCDGGEGYVVSLCILRVCVCVAADRIFLCMFRRSSSFEGSVVLLNGMPTYQ